MAIAHGLRIHVVDHLPRDAQLLIHAAHHDLLVDRLILAADEVMVGVHVEVAHGAHVDQRLVDEDVVHVEGVLGQDQLHLAQHLGAIVHRVHEQVLARQEGAYLVPAEFIALRQHVAVAHDLLLALIHLVVDVVGHHHVAGHRRVQLAAQVHHEREHGRRIEPVVGVDHFEVEARRMGEPRVHRAAVALVGLMDGADDVGVLVLPAVADGRRVVFGRAVVHEQDLDVLAAGEQRLHAVIHVGCRVVAGHGERDGLQKRLLRRGLGVRACCLARRPRRRPSPSGSSRTRPARRRPPCPC